MSTSEDLHARRLRAVRAWTQFVSDGDEEGDAVRPEILSSWQLSGVVSPAVTHAPWPTRATPPTSGTSRPCRPR